MNNFGKNFSELLKQKGLNPNKLAKLLGEDAPLIHKIAKGHRSPSDRIIQKLIAMPELNLTYEELLAWQLADKYPEEALKIALKVLEKKEQNK